MSRVHILASCPNPKLIEYTTLVFRTLRVGFPTATVTVWLNNMGQAEESKLSRLCVAGDNEARVCDYSHHEWIEMLCGTEKEPFWICDTDVIFFESMEDYRFSGAISGWRIPEWDDEFTGCITRPRIHTCLMHIRPADLAEDIAAFKGSYNAMEDISPLPNLFAPLVVPMDGRHYFYDVCGMLHHAVIGEAFTDEIKDKFFHFNFGTISDRVLPHVKDGKNMAAAREMVLNDPQLGRGAWRLQEEYYRQHQYSEAGQRIEDSLSEEDMRLALQWNQELCQNNHDAMQFCDLWHHYVHGIDDLIDTMQDGRPIMSQDQIIGLFFHAAVLYNSAFFVSHRNLLFPIVLDITATYSDSVAWEKSPKSHLRLIADVLRTCGGQMYFMVALICGGPEHMRTMSRKIRERDWLSQHNQT